MATPVLVNGPTGVLATAINVRGQSNNVMGYHIYNPSNATAYVQFFDTVLGPTVGTTVPNWSIGIPTVSHAFLPVSPAAGLFFLNGLWVAATTTAGGLTAPSAAVNVNLAMS